MTITFLMTTLIVVATPGSGLIYTLSAGLSHGRRSSVIAAFGATLGIVPAAVAAVTGLAALLHASPLAFQIVRYLGVAYLLYLAVMTLRDKGSLVTDTSVPARSPGAVILSGILMNTLNPQLTLFFLAFLPQFVPPGAPDSVLRMVLLSAVFMLVTFVVFAACGICAALVRDRITERPTVMTWVRRVFACSFVTLGIKLALAAR
jgi:threonine/homoserine/homoserine lactone efflux protein